MSDGQASPGRGALVVIDATALVADPTCASTAWRILAQATRAWGVEIYVPAVAVAEAVAGYSRRIDEALVGLKRWDEKHARALGLSFARDAEALLNRDADEYHALLSEKLSAIPVMTLPVPDVSHEVLVQRATSRQKPFNARGDGYRDTLNWLSIVALLRGVPDVPLIWVSDNSADFEGDLEGELHPDLLRELAATGNDQRVRWVRKLSDAVVQLASSHIGNAPHDAQRLQTFLEQQAIRDFVANLLAGDAVGTQLSPELAALPLGTEAAVLLELSELDALDFAAKAELDEGVAVVEFSAVLNALIEVSLPPNASMPDDVVLLEQGGSAQIGSLEKPLRVEGILEVDTFGRPSSGEITTIRAVEDDPGIRAWSTRRRLASSLPSGAATSDAMLRLIEGMQVNTGVSESTRKLIEGLQIDTGISETTRKLIEGIQVNTGISETTRKFIEGLQVDTRISETTRKFIEGIQVNTGISESIRKLIEGLDSGINESTRKLIEGLQIDIGPSSDRKDDQVPPDEAEADGEGEGPRD